MEEEAEASIVSGPWLWIFSLAALVLVVTRFVLHWEEMPTLFSARHLPSTRKMSFLSASMFAGLFETSSLLHIISGIWYFNQCPPRSSIMNVLRNRLLARRQFRRFWSIARRNEMKSALNAEFVEIPLHRFDLEHHVIDSSVDSVEDITLLVEGLLSEPMDPTIPLWSIHRIECKNGGGGALLFRVHHCMCDGVSLMGVMMQMLSRECGGSLVPVRPNNHQARTGLFMNIIYFLFSLWGSIKALLKIAALHFMSDTPTRLSVPEELFSSGRSRPELAWEQDRKLTVSPYISLDYIKRVRQAISGNVTVNDILFSAVGGAVQHYLTLLDQSHPIRQSKKKDLMLRALVPFAFWPDPNADLGNRWSTLSVPLSVRPMSSLARVRESKRVLDGIKASPEGILQMVLYQLAGAVFPFEYQRRAVIDQLRRHTIAFSNVRGPQERLFFEGKYEVTAMQSLVPNAIPQLTIVSYNGAVSLSLVSDRAVVTQPELLIKAFVDEIKSIGDAAGVHDKLLFSA